MTNYEELFDECAVARDGAGFLGSVPDCIAHFSGIVHELRDIRKDATMCQTGSQVNIYFDTSEKASKFFDFMESC